MTPEDYVSYPLALALKKAGFDELCRDFYWTSDGTFKHTDAPVHKNSEHCTTMVAAPTLWQTQKWLREVKKWHIIVEPRIWEQQVYDFKLWHYYRGYENANRGFDYPSYESALSAGIATALELIEKKGE